jgi:hypothetical protein
MTSHNISEVLKRKDISNKMTQSLEKTRENKCEHTFDICSGVDVPTTDIEKGSEYHVDIRKKCPIGTKSLGNFHTHVYLSESNNDAIPSSGDMIETIERDLNFVCVSGHHNNGGQITRCFHNNDIKSEIGNILNKKKLEPNEDNVRKSARSVTKKMMKDKDYLEKMSHGKIVYEYV